MPASDMNGIEGVVYVILVLAGFCLAGALLAGPLAVVGVLVGGRLRGAAFVAALMAVFVGAVGVLLVTAAYLFLGSMFGAMTAGLLLLPPLASLILGAVALWLRRKRSTSPAV